MFPGLQWSHFIVWIRDGVVLVYAVSTRLFVGPTWHPWPVFILSMVIFFHLPRCTGQRTELRPWLLHPSPTMAVLASAITAWSGQPSPRPPCSHPTLHVTASPACPHHSPPPSTTTSPPLPLVPCHLQAQHHLQIFRLDHPLGPSFLFYSILLHSLGLKDIILNLIEIHLNFHASNKELNS